MARDHRDKIIAMSILDICPTLDMYEQTTKEFAKAYFHWFFLIQPKFLPENMIKSDPRKWMKSCLDKWSGNHNFGKVEEAYLKSFRQFKRIHGSCEDYRASATIDFACFLVATNRIFLPDFAICFKILAASSTIATVLFKSITCIPLRSIKT